jgi:putative endonuclease
MLPTDLPFFEDKATYGTSRAAASLHGLHPWQHQRYAVYRHDQRSGCRVRQHQKHVFGGFTEKYEVTRLLYYEVFGRAADAIGREKQLKGWRREKKVALIEKENPQWRDLSREWDELRLRQKPAETFGEV